MPFRNEPNYTRREEKKMRIDKRIFDGIKQIESQNSNLKKKKPKESDITIFDSFTVIYSEFGAQMLRAFTDYSPIFHSRFNGS